MGLLVSVCSGYYCCVTSNPKTSGWEQLLNFAHNFVGQKFWKNTAGLFNPHPCTSATVAGAGGYPSKMASSPTCLETLHTWLLLHRASSYGLDFSQHCGLRVFIFLIWQVASKRPRKRLPILMEAMPRSGVVSLPSYPISQSNHRVARVKREGQEPLLLNARCINLPWYPTSRSGQKGPGNYWIWRK